MFEAYMITMFAVLAALIPLLSLGYLAIKIAQSW